MLFRVVKILILFVISIVFVTAIIYINNPHSLIYIYVGDDEKTIWLETKYIPFKKIISDTDYYKFPDAQWSPNDRYFSYYDFVRLEWVNKEVALKIFDARFLTTKTIFIGPDKTSEYEWLDNDTIRVHVSMGVGVKTYRDIDINVDKPIIAVDDYISGDWTPEKTF